MDPNQSRGTSQIESFTLKLFNTFRNVSIYSFREPPSSSDPLRWKIFTQASQLVSLLFLEKRINIDLDAGISEEHFTVDILVDSTTFQVLGVSEYLFMRKYLWIECFAILPIAQKQGIGKWFMKHLKSMASHRQKSILLYSLIPVIVGFLSF
jgi:GNAT superfamily N-acetyltransferase